MKKALSTILIVLLPVLLLADEIELKDGTVIKGEIIQILPEQVEIDPEGEKPFLIIKREEIRRLLYKEKEEVFSESEKQNMDNRELSNEEKLFRVRESKNNRYSLSAGAGKMSGHTTYQIGGDLDTPEGSTELHFPLSELEFPLDVYTAFSAFEADIYESFALSMNFEKNITKDAGIMKDSDWGVPFEYPYQGSGDYYWYGEDHLDIYSESESELDALIIDINLMYRVLKMRMRGGNWNLRFLAGLGYLYQRFNFECELLRQWDLRPDIPDDQNANFEGDGRIGIIYDVRQKIPYIKAAAEIVYLEDYVFNIDFGYSPLVRVDDEDQHVLRDMVSRADCEGSAVLFSIGGRVYFRGPFFLSFKFDYVSTDTEGREKQYDEGEYSGTIDQKNFSKRENYEISAGYGF